MFEKNKSGYGSYLVGVEKSSLDGNPRCNDTLRVHLCVCPGGSTHRPNPTNFGDRGTHKIFLV